MFSPLTFRTYLIRFHYRSQKHEIIHTTTASSVSILDLHVEFGISGYQSTRIYDKGDYFIFEIKIVPLHSSKKPTSTCKGDFVFFNSFGI